MNSLNQSVSRPLDKLKEKVEQVLQSELPEEKAEAAGQRIGGFIEECGEEILENLESAPENQSARSERVQCQDTKNCSDKALEEEPFNLIEVVVDLINELSGGCFSYNVTRRNFALMLLGIFFSVDSGAITNWVRTLGLGDKAYNKFDRLLRTPAVKLRKAKEGWIALIGLNAPALLVETGLGPLAILPADGTSDPCEHKRNPCAELGHQSSSDSRKRQKTAMIKYNAVGLSCETDGYEHVIVLDITHVSASGTTDCLTGEERVSEFVALQRQALWIARTLFESGSLPLTEEGRVAAIVVTDSGSYAANVLLEIDRALERGEPVPYWIVKVSSDAKAYEKPPENQSGRGRPRKKGEKVKFQEVFKDPSYAEKFRKAEIKKPDGTIGHYEVMEMDLLWNEGMYREMRFVLSRDLDEGTEAVFMTDAPFLTAEQAVYVYLRRFSQEHGFKDIKQVQNGFGVGVWSKSVERARTWEGNDSRKEKLASLEGKDRENAIKAIEATNRVAFLSCVNQGVKTLLSMESVGKMGHLDAGYCRRSAGGGPDRLSVAEVHRLAADSIETVLTDTRHSEIVRHLESLDPHKPEGTGRAFSDLSGGLAGKLKNREKSKRI